MLQNVTKIEPFEWSEAKETAAQELAEGSITDKDIADKVEVTRQTLYRWKEHPEFRARVDEYIAAYRERIFNTGIARKEVRIRAKHDRWLLLNQVIEERGKDPELKDVAGGSTGLIVVREAASRVLGKEYAVDAGTLSAISALEKEVAAELGHITSKHELSGSVSGYNLSALTAEELAALDTISVKASAKH